MLVNKYRPLSIGIYFVHVEHAESFNTWSLLAGKIAYYRWASNEALAPARFNDHLETRRRIEPCKRSLFFFHL